MSEKTPKLSPLQSLEIPVEILLIFMENDLEYFSSMDMDKILRARNIELQSKRIYQILNAFEKSGKLISESRPNSSDTGKPAKPIKYYLFNYKLAEKLLPTARYTVEDLTRILEEHQNGGAQAPAEEIPPAAPVEAAPATTGTNGQTPKSSSANILDEYEIIVKRIQSNIDGRG